MSAFDKLAGVGRLVAGAAKDWDLDERDRWLREHPDEEAEDNTTVLVEADE